MSKIIGIDLGTTNSCVAVVEAFSPRVLANRDGSRTTPSIVAFTPDGDRLVGQIAKRQAITNPQQTVFAVKRLIGRKFEDPNVQRARDLLPYALVEAANGDVKIQIRDRQHSPEEISAFVLRELKAFSEEVLGEPVREAIITVPAYFDDHIYPNPRPGTHAWNGSGRSLTACGPRRPNRHTPRYPHPRHRLDRHHNQPMMPMGLEVKAGPQWPCLVPA